MPARRQFERAITVNRRLDGCLVEECREVAAERRFPLARGTFGIGSNRGVNLGLCECFRIERRGRPLHDEDTITADAEMVAVLLVQQPNLSVRGADTNQHSLRGHQRGKDCAVNLDVRDRAHLVAPHAHLIEDHGEEGAAAHRAKRVGVGADDDAALQPDLGGVDAVDLLPQYRALLEERRHVFEDDARLIA
jgi:hypothetical protein